MGLQVIEWVREQRERAAFAQKERYDDVHRGTRYQLTVGDQDPIQRILERRCRMVSWRIGQCSRPPC